MGFGSKIGSVAAFKKKAASGNGAFIQYIPKDGRYKVRFMDDPDEWIGYSEVWNPLVNRGYPLPDGEAIPDGCRASQRYLVNAIDRENDRVIPLQLPRSLVKQLIVQFENFGTLTDRDYILLRSGSGKDDTTYTAAPDAPTKLNISKFTALDLEAVLEDAYNYVMGISGDEAEEEEIVTPKRRTKATGATTAKKPAPRKAAAQVEEEEEEEAAEDDEYEEEEVVEEEAEEEAEEEEEEAEEEEEEEAGEEAWTREELEELSPADLRATAKLYDIKVLKSSKDEALIEAILNYEEPEEF